MFLLRSLHRELSEALGPCRVGAVKQIVLANGEEVVTIHFVNGYAATLVVKKVFLMYEYKEKLVWNVDKVEKEISKEQKKRLQVYFDGISKIGINELDMIADILVPNRDVINGSMSDLMSIISPYGLEVVRGYISKVADENTDHRHRDGAPHTT